MNDDLLNALLGRRLPRSLAPLDTGRLRPMTAAELHAWRCSHEGRLTCPEPSPAMSSRTWPPGTLEDVCGDAGALDVGAPLEPRAMPVYVGPPHEEPGD